MAVIWTKSRQRELEKEANWIADEYQSGSWEKVFANFDESGNRIRPDEEVKQ